MIKIFTPPKFNKSPLNMLYLKQATQKEWIYTANGRSSIFHILKIYNIKKLLVPSYICDSILMPLKSVGVEPIFYDVDIEDLNPSIESIVNLSSLFKANAVLVASLYGNPANLVEIEKFCIQKKIILIDDAAQSFGATLDNRYIGSFGNAGFFSFGPGKPTAGHLGSFMHADNEIVIQRESHCLFHLLKWVDFYINRYKIYSQYPKIFKKTINVLVKIVNKMIDIKNDNICKFETDILGGIIESNLYKQFEFRNKYVDEFDLAFKNNGYFRILRHVRGEPNNHKIVVLFYEKQYAKNFIMHMRKMKIYVSNGYQILTNDFTYLPNSSKINECVVEMPIEDNAEHMKLIFNETKFFLGDL